MREFIDWCRKNNVTIGKAAMIVEKLVEQGIASSEEEAIGMMMRFSNTAEEGL